MPDDAIVLRSPSPCRIGILISGRGSNMEAIVKAHHTGRIPGSEIACVISDKPEAGGIERAHGLGVKTRVIPRAKDESREDHDGRIMEALGAERVHLVCLAGYMRLLSAKFVKAFENRILNVHPSLLPAFPGVEAQRQAFEHGVKVTGASVHIVTEALDAGPIISQVPVTVWDHDDLESLTERILEKEHRIYPEAVSLYVQGRLRIAGRRVTVLPRHGA